MKLRSYCLRILGLIIITITGSITTAFSAGLSGTYTVYSGGNYNTISAAITALNTNGVAGPVIFNIGIPGSTTSYTETITATLSITATGTATNTITFQQAPTNTGAHPLITAYATGTATTTSATQDGIWRLIGSDYVTISGIDLKDPNTASALTEMEYGYALYRASVTNGCQNVVIKNCVITLNRNNSTAGTAPASNGSTGILSANSTATAATTALAPTTAVGSNSNNDFYSNTIQNCNIGIYIVGSNTTGAGADVNNDVGGNSVATGNNIINFGGGTTPATTACGVSTLYQQTLNVSYNTINNNNGSGINHTLDLRGILIGTSTTAAANINYNTITIKGGGTTQTTSAIENQAGTVASNTVNINNNTITGSYTTSTSGLYAAIYNSSGAPATLNINSNSITGISCSRAGGCHAIANTAAVGTINVSGNTVYGFTITAAGGYFDLFFNNAAVVTAINVSSNFIGTSSQTPVTYNTNANTTAANFIGNYGGAATANLSITNNTFYSPTFSVACSGAFAFISNTGATLSQNISSNIFNNCSFNTSSDLTIISNAVTLPANGVQNINNNSITGTLAKTVAGGNLYLYNGGSVTSPSTATINHNSNNFSGITVTGATVIQGWVYTDAGSPASYIAQKNTFGNWTAGTGTVTAININITGNNNSITSNNVYVINGAGAITGITTSAGNDNIFANVLYTLVSSSTTAICSAISVTGGTTQEVYRNEMDDIDNSAATTTAGAVNGILVSGGTTVNVYNNIMGNFTATAGAGTDVIRGISVTSTTANSNINVYFNTIYLSATSSGATFGTSGMYQAANATSTTAALDLRNNIFLNASVPKGTALTVAFRRSATALNNYATTSNNNLFYAGTPSSTALIYYDGTNSYQTLASYQALVSTRDANSVTQDLRPAFLSTTGGSPSFLHIDNLATTVVNNAGITISGYTTDYDGQTRGNPPDIGADEILYTNGWLGVTSTDWNDASNWDANGVPASDGDVDIPAGKTFYPVLVTGGTYDVHNLNVRSGASVTLNGGTLQIAGGTVTGGTFTVSAAAGIVEYNGTQAQTIPASAFAGNTIANLKTNNSGAGITLAGALNLTGILYPTSGTFNANGNLTLVSSATQTALVDGTGAGTVTGNVTMQRYLAAGFGYKYISSPVQGATVAAFSSLVNLSASFPNFYNYTESNTNTGFASYTTTTNALTPLVGYAVDFGSSTAAATISISGVLNNGTLTPLTLQNTNKTYTQGFNLVGNPYPSPIDWNAASGWTKTNIDNALYFFESDSTLTSQYTGTYSTYVNGVSTVRGSNLIASMQGFFVHVSNGTYPVTGTFGMTNAVRVNNLTAYFHRYNSIGNSNNSVRSLIRLSASYSSNPQSADPVVVYTDNTATKNFNGQLDAVKLMNDNDNVPNLYIRNPNNTKLAINALNVIDTNTIVPLSLQLPKDGTVNFALQAAENLPGGIATYLYDASIGKHIPLKSSSSYSVKLAAGIYDNRFYLTTNTNDEVAPNADNFYVYRKDGNVYANIRFTNNLPGTLSLINITGNVVNKQQVAGNGIYELGSPKVLGVYVITFISQGKIHAKKIFIPQ